MLLHDGTTSIRAVAASNPTITPETAQRASCDEMALGCGPRRRNARLPEDDLVRVASDVDPEVQHEPRVCNERLTPALADGSPPILTPRSERGLPPTASPEEDPEPARPRSGSPRLPRMARNPSTPSETLHELSAALPHSCSAILRLPKACSQPARWPAIPRLRLQVSRNPATPGKALSRLATDPDRRVLARAHQERLDPEAGRQASRVTARDARPGVPGEGQPSRVRWPPQPASGRDAGVTTQAGGFGMSPRPSLRWSQVTYLSTWIFTRRAC